MLRRKDTDPQFLKFLDSQFENFTDAFFDYQYPTVILPKNLEIDAICKVFQTINTTGLKLSAFDICVARFMPSGIKLKEDLEEAKNDFPEISPILNDDETVILQTIALLSNVSAKKNSLPKNLKASHISSEWAKVVFSMKNCVDILDDLGVGISSGLQLLPYQPIISVISAVLAKVNYEYETNQSKKASIQEKIRKWFFTVCLNLRYTEGTDNKMKDDYEFLLEWINLGNQPEYMEQPISWYLNEIAKANKNGAFGKAILVALNSNQPKDFYTNSQVGFGKGVTENCDQHHIFPQASYKENPLINSVFNFTFLTSKSNQFIKAKRTDEYVKKIPETTHTFESQLKEKMKRHFIDDNCYNSLLSEDLTSFINYRVLNFKTFMVETLGLPITITEKQREDIVDIEDNFSQ